VDYDAGTQRDTAPARSLPAHRRPRPADPTRASRDLAGGRLHTMRSLVPSQYLARGTGGWSVLLHATMMRRTPTTASPTATTTRQALLRLQLLPSTRRALPVRNHPHCGSLAGRPRRVRDVGAVSVRWQHGTPPPPGSGRPRGTAGPGGPCAASAAARSRPPRPTTSRTGRPASYGSAPRCEHGLGRQGAGLCPEPDLPGASRCSPAAWMGVSAAGWMEPGSVRGFPAAAGAGQAA
jgi:hypothetical protein